MKTVRKADLVKIELEQHLAEALAYPDKDRDHEEVARLNAELAYLEKHHSEY